MLQFVHKHHSAVHQQDEAHQKQEDSTLA